MRLLDRRWAVLALAVLLSAACTDDDREGTPTTTSAEPTTTAPVGAVTDEDDEKIAEDFIAWARSHDRRVPPLAGSVRLILGPEAHAEIVLDKPGERSTWIIPADLWRGYEGPFKPLNHLAGPENVVLTMGATHGHCAHSTSHLSPDVAGLRQITIQPVDFDSCLSWYSIGLFVNDAGQIEAVVLDASEP